MWKCIKRRHFVSKKISYQTLDEKIDVIYQIICKNNIGVSVMMANMFTYLVWYTDFDSEFPKMEYSISSKIFREHQCKMLDFLSNF